MKPRLAFPKKRRSTGSILPMAMVSLAVIASMAASALYRVQPRMASTYHSASWHDALHSAEAGADLALAALNLSLTDPATAWAGWTPSDATTFPKTWEPAIVAHAGEGNNKLYCKLTVDNSVVDADGRTWMRVRSLGAAELPVASRSGIEGALLDVHGNKSHRAILRRERYSSDVTGGALNVPQVVRTIEAIAAPPGARAYQRAITAAGAIVLTGATHVDSFESSDPAKSTGGQYDPTKRREKGAIGTNGDGAASNLGSCPVRGDVSTNGGRVQNGGHISGSEYNNFSAHLPEVSAPTWTSFSFYPTAVTNPAVPTTLSGGPSGAPQKYRLSDITISSASAPLILAPHTAGAESYVKIWVTGRVTVSGDGFIQQQPGVYVEFYIEDDISLAGGGIVNQTGLAKNLTIYGVTPASGYRNAAIQGAGDFLGIVNAPAFNLTNTGTGRLIGAFITRTATISSSGGVHYDEDLANHIHAEATKYQYASWVEHLH